MRHRVRLPVRIGGTVQDLVDLFRPDGEFLHLPWLIPETLAGRFIVILQTITVSRQRKRQVHIVLHLFPRHIESRAMGTEY